MTLLFILVMTTVVGVIGTLLYIFSWENDMTLLFILVMTTVVGVIGTFLSLGLAYKERRDRMQETGRLKQELQSWYHWAYSLRDAVTEYHKDIANIDNDVSDDALLADARRVIKDLEIDVSRITVSMDLSANEWNVNLDPAKTPSTSNDSQNTHSI